MGTVELDEHTHEFVRFAAHSFGTAESEVVARAVRGMKMPRQGDGDGPADPWQPIELAAEYEGHRVTALYLPATTRVTITSEPLPDTRFKSPSGAASAVVIALKPARRHPQTNGWKFWHIAASNAPLEVLRPRSPR